MTISKNVAEMEAILTKMKNYDAEQFSRQILDQVKELDFFYSNLVARNKGNASKTFYKVSPANKRPSEGQVAYFNLRRGYPKEVYDGHYCYVLKDFKYKYLIVPLTSVKDKSSPYPNFEFDIKIKNFTNDKVSRMQISDMRTIDIQRINENHYGGTVYDVETDRQSIVDAVTKIISLQVMAEVVK